jgi:hypothetical protein
VNCKICTSVTSVLFSTLVLNKYQVQYYRCPACGFVETETPYWLNESYVSAMNDIDLGPINRSLECARLAEGLILSSFDRNASFVDYGAGFGVFVRMMRDRGFDFYWHDRYCDNLFAKHFVAQAGTRYEMATAFEVFEHLVDPMIELEQLFAFSRTVLFSTLIVPPDVRSPGDWWYFSPEHGQHVSFYSVRSLELIAKRYGCQLYSDGLANHLLTDKPISERVFRHFTRGSLLSRLARRVMRQTMRKKSLLSDDFFKVSGSKL